MNSKNNLDFYRVVRDFLTVYLEKQKCASRNTIISYRQTLNLYLDYLSVRENRRLADFGFADMNFKNVIEFLDDLQFSRHCSSSTRNQRLYALKSFARYAGIMYHDLLSIYMELDSIPIQKSDKKIVESIPENALQCILGQPNTEKKTGLRDMCFMILMYDAAARDREMLDLTVGSLFLDKSTPILHIKGKGNKTRIVPIMSKTAQHMKKYLKVFHPHGNNNDFLFYTIIHGKHQQMSDDNVARFLKKYGDMSRRECPDFPKHIHPHMFRHARAIHLYRNGMPLPLLSEFMGHATLQSTMIYAYADTEMKRKAILKATKQDNISLTKELVPNWQKDDDLIRQLYGLK